MKKKYWTITEIPTCSKCAGRLVRKGKGNTYECKHCGRTATLDKKPKSISNDEGAS